MSRPLYAGLLKSYLEILHSHLDIFHSLQFALFMGPDVGAEGPNKGHKAPMRALNETPESFFTPITDRNAGHVDKPTKIIDQEST